MANKKFRVTIWIDKSITRMVTAPNGRTALKKVKDAAKAKHKVGARDLNEVATDEVIF